MILSFPSGRTQKPSRKLPSSEAPDANNIGHDVPLRLKDAARIAFPFGGMTASGLRREAKRGRLTIERIAGKDYTTLHFIEEMRQRCRNELAKDHDSGCNPSATKKAGAPGKQPGSSVTMDRYSSALAALERTAQGLNAPCKTTSLGSTKSAASAAAIPNKY